MPDHYTSRDGTANETSHAPKTNGIRIGSARVSLKVAMNRPVALITGGARRVGRAIALHLARGGYDIIVTYNRSQADSLSLKSELEAIGARALMLRGSRRGT